MSEGTAGSWALYKLCTTLYATSEELTPSEASTELAGFVLPGLVVLNHYYGVPYITVLD